MRDLHRVGHVGRVVQQVHAAVGAVDPVDHARRRRDQVEAEFAVEPLLHDLQVQQAEEAAAEAEAEGRRVLRLVFEPGVVQAQLGEAFAQEFEIRRVGREQPQNTTGRLGWKPGSGSGAGLRSSVIVSPTLQSATVLMAALT